MWYNGPVEVTAVGPDPYTEFQFQLPVLGIEGDPGSDSNSRPNHFAPGYFARVWQVRRFVVEDNVIEAADRIFHPEGGLGRPAAIFVYGSTVELQHLTTPSVTLSERRFPQVVIRGNVVRQRDSGFDPNPANISAQVVGIEAWHVHDLVLDKNFITLDLIYPMYLIECTTVLPFKNQSILGSLVPARDGFTGIVSPDRETTLLASFEESTLLSIVS